MLFWAQEEIETKDIELHEKICAFQKGGLVSDPLVTFVNPFLLNNGGNLDVTFLSLGVLGSKVL